MTEQKDARIPIPKIEMPDLDIREWVAQIELGLGTTINMKITLEIDNAIRKYNTYRRLAGHIDLTKPQALLHFMKLGLEALNYKKPPTVHRFLEDIKAGRYKQNTMQVPAELTKARDKYQYTQRGLDNKVNSPEFFLHLLWLGYNQIEFPS